MTSKSRPTPQSLWAQFPKKSRTPLSQIARATWASTLILFAAAIFTLVVAFTTNGKATSNIWTANAAVLIAVGGIILKGALGTLLGIALYQHLWSMLARPASESHKAGLTVKNIESLHLASRLSVSMIVHPSLSGAWIIGLLALFATSALVPALQAGVRVVAKSVVIPTTVQINHAQLDPRMATRQGAQQPPEDAMPNIRRSSINALFGEQSGHAYTKQNLTGQATFGPINFTDVECVVESREGIPTARDWYYNFTSKLTDDLPTGGLYSSMSFNATLQNGTHFLYYKCSLRPAQGSCSTNLSGGVGQMKDLRCIRTNWMDPVPNVIEGPATGFHAIAKAFANAFDGEASTTLATMRPQENSTFVQATARFSNRTVFIMPPELISHVQRVIWHAPIDAQYLAVPASEQGGRYDLNGTIDLHVLNEQPVLVIKMNFHLIISVVGCSLLAGLISVFYLIVAPNKIVGRLMRDSLVHSLTVGGNDGPGIRGACIASLEKVLRDAGGERLKYDMLTEATPEILGRIGIREVGEYEGPVQETTPSKELFYG